ncbi:MAG TPA: zf-HC2 domain-containing protein [Gemmatimonadaceae bacterium]|nr:zf-HC2 domain-containing protein [Gemmatimonadaceae bacterium]
MRMLTRFTCEEAFRRLDDFLDRELSAAEMALVHEHLEICAGCAREFNFERSVLSGVRAKLRQIDVPVALQARVAALLERGGARDDG